MRVQFRHHLTIMRRLPATILIATLAALTACQGRSIPPPPPPVSQRVIDAITPLDPQPDENTVVIRALQVRPAKGGLYLELLVESGADIERIQKIAQTVAVESSIMTYWDKDSTEDADALQFVQIRNTRTGATINVYEPRVNRKEYLQAPLITTGDIISLFAVAAPYYDPSDSVAKSQIAYDTPDSSGVIQTIAWRCDLLPGHYALDFSEELRERLADRASQGEGEAELLSVEAMLNSIEFTVPQRD